MKNLILLTLIVFVLGACCDKPSTSADGTMLTGVKISSDKDKTLYTMGVMLGGNLQRLGLAKDELQALMKGLESSALGLKAEVNVEEYRPKIQQLVMQRMQVSMEKNKKKGDTYIDDFVKKEGAKKTASGLTYKIIKEGKGIKPAAEDTVEVHYHGTLIDGTVFDSSVERKKTTSFPLNRVIKGWTEGLQLIGEGGKVKLVIPPDLAYGERGAGKIPGGATLTFEVELIKITKAKKDGKNAAKKKPAKAMKKK